MKKINSVYLSNTNITTTDLTNILDKQKKIIDAINSVSKRLACYKAYTGGTNLQQSNTLILLI